MKKPITILALATAAGCALTISGCSSCSGTTILNTAALSSNWYSMTTYNNIQPTFKGESNAERAVYTVTHEKAALANSYYSVEFAKAGTYETLFYATDFDYNSLGNSEYAAEYAAATDNKTIPVYYYKTTFDMPEMVFKMGDKSTETLHESMVTECYFLPVKDRLRPLYSKMSVVSHTPANQQASSLDGLYKVIDRTYENFYSYNGGSVKTKIEYNTDDFQYSADAKWQTCDLDDAANVLFDNNAINIAVRAMDLKPTLSQSVSLFAPNSGVQNYRLAGSSATLGESEHKAVTDVLKGKGLYSPTEEKPLIETAAVAVSYIGDLTGVSQTYWFAAITNPKNNVAHATMLKMSMPLSYGLGTLNYVLTELN